uniref:Association with the SNF1 complex (ASC) domain-containing protein n=1 Tax=Salix viminalis TaxID=40686 RepID=A0A6N2MBI1_SALVM
MGNVSGKNEGEGTSSSGVKYGGEEGKEFVVHGRAAPTSYHCQGVYAEAEPMVHSPTHNPGGYLQPPLFAPQDPMAPLPRSGEITQVPNYALVPNTTDFRGMFPEKLRAVMITWSFDGKQVAVTGSWDNWNRREPLQRTGKDFVIMKMLPAGVYHYRFIVDENLRHVPDLPWERDDSGSAYNILDLQEYVPEALESLSEFESSPSPDSSYNNESLKDNDFGKLPPDIPPQLQLTPLSEQSSATDSYQLQRRPRHAVLNHLYIQNNRGEPVALGSTNRFLQKYVTVVLYKPTRR